MKKFLTTLLICILSAISIFAFTACDDETVKGNGGGSGNNTEKDVEVRYTVTEEEWNEAIGFFDIYEKIEIGDGIEFDRGKIEKILNLKVIRDYVAGPDSDGEVYKYYDVFEMDNLKKMFSQSADYNGEKLAYYCWESNGNFYYYDTYLAGLELFTESQVLSILENSILDMTGDIFVVKLFSNYSEFSFDKETNSYKGLVNTIDGIYSVNLKFVNGKLYEISELGSELGGVTKNYTIEYDVAVAIPDEILNMAN